LRRSISTPQSRKRRLRTARTRPRRSRRSLLSETFKAQTDALRRRSRSKKSLSTKAFASKKKRKT
jgi:hypothetical protein